MSDEGGRGVGQKWKWMLSSFFNLIYFQGPVAEIMEEFLFCWRLILKNGEKC